MAKCEHGYRRQSKCPACRDMPGAGSAKQRSVWEDRRTPGVDGVDGIRGENWEHIGELGGRPLDFSKVGGWMPIGEFLGRRR